MVNLLKYALNLARGEPVKVLASYDPVHDMLRGTVIHCGKGLSSGELDRLRVILDSDSGGSGEDSEILGLVLCKKIVE